MFLTWIFVLFAWDSDQHVSIFAQQSKPFFTIEAWLSKQTLIIGMKEKAVFLWFGREREKKKGRERECACERECVRESVWERERVRWCNNMVKRPHMSACYQHATMAASHPSLPSLPPVARGSTTLSHPLSLSPSLPLSKLLLQQWGEILSKVLTTDENWRCSRVLKKKKTSASYFFFVKKKKRRFRRMQKKNAAKISIFSSKKLIRVKSSSSEN